MRHHKKNTNERESLRECEKFSILIHGFSFVVFFSFSLQSYTENASRFCYANGTWDSYANYDQCNQIDLTYGIETLPHLEYITHIWTAGYTLSLVSLILGIAIFIHFKWVTQLFFLQLIFINLLYRIFQVVVGGTQNWKQTKSSEFLNLSWWHLYKSNSY